jgi:hypothetical protein
MVARDSVPFLPALVVALVAGGPLSAQPPSPLVADPAAGPLVLRDFTLFLDGAHPMGSGGATGQSARIRLFRMPTGFLADPVGLEDDDDTSPADIGPDHYDPELDGRVGLALGMDNPYFDLRRPGDPGGVGYYKVHSQYQILEGRSTEVSFVLRAVAPAGLDCDGVASGLTVFSPSLAWFQELSEGVAIQGFVGKEVPANASWMASVRRGVQYGLGLQAPLCDAAPGQPAEFHFFVEALGCHRRFTTIDLPANTWEVLPGVHWRLTDDCWLSGGVSFPVGTPRFDSRLWQITCSWEF